jgi:endonuclease-3
MKKIQIEKMFRRFQALNPQPTTELLYKSPFELLIAVILSAQATDISVNKATEKLFTHAATPEKILRLGVEGLKKEIKTIGLYNSKAANILKTCKMLVELHHSEVPQEREALEALPGVGRKTANVILNTYFGLPTIAVDTHIFRVAHRLNLACGTTPRAVEDELMQIVPKKYLQNAHHWILLHGRYVCMARKPRCPTCFIADLCPFLNKTSL